MTCARALFRSLSADGGVYLFVIEDRDRWTIQLNGDVIASGSTDECGISEAIATFRALPTVTPPARTLRVAS